MLKIASGSSKALVLGVVAAAADIPVGSELVALHGHIPLRFDQSSSESSDGGGDGLRYALIRTGSPGPWLE